jgi:cell division septation protein DedD
MADRYQDRPFPADDGYNRRTDPRAPANVETDPLAELARLIGQTDPYATAMGRANQPVQPRGGERGQHQRPPAPDDITAAGPPPWMQRANRQERRDPPQLPPQDYPSQAYQNQDYPSQDHPSQDHPGAVHPLHRYATARGAPAAEPHYQDAPPFADARHDHEPDPARYDDALYGEPDSAAEEPQYSEAYADDPYGYQDGYDDGAEEDPVRKRGGGMMTVAIVLALAVVGTGAAFAYRTYVGTPRSGEPPIIRADAGPTKIVPAPADATAKLPDRMVAGDGAEKIVPREEAPVDVNARSGGPRVVFPQLNPNTNPPPAASVASNSLPPASGGNGTLPNNEPRKIRTLSVKGDQPDAAATPVGAPPPAKPAPATRSVAAPATNANPANANASANAPMSLTPQAPPAIAVTEPRSRVAATNPAANPEPAAPAAAAAAGGGYLVQISSQRSENDAQASFKALQGKFPAVLGSRASVIKRADLGEKGVYYRAMVGPFASSDEATQFCVSLKAAGGQCVIPRN